MEVYMQWHLATHFGLPWVWFIWSQILWQFEGEYTSLKLFVSLLFLIWFKVILAYVVSKWPGDTLQCPMVMETAMTIWLEGQLREPFQLLIISWFYLIRMWLFCWFWSVKLCFFFHFCVQFPPPKEIKSIITHIHKVVETADITIQKITS